MVDHGAKIHLVAQNTADVLAVPQLGRALSSAVAGGRWDVALIEHPGDLPGCPAPGRLPEDPPHHSRRFLLRHHDALRCPPPVAIMGLDQQRSRFHFVGEDPADLQAVLPGAALVEPRLQREKVFIVILAFKEDLPTMLLHQFHKGKALLQIAPQTGGILEDDDLHLAPLYPPQDPLHPLEGSSAAVVVHDDVHHIGQAPFFAKGFEHIPLRLDAFIVFPVFIPAFPAVDQRGSGIFLRFSSCRTISARISSAVFRHG